MESIKICMLPILTAAADIDDQKNQDNVGALGAYSASRYYFLPSSTSEFDLRFLGLILSLISGFPKISLLLLGCRH